MASKYDAADLLAQIRGQAAAAAFEKPEESAILQEGEKLMAGEPVTEEPEMEADPTESNLATLLQDRRVSQFLKR